MACPYCSNTQFFSSFLPSTKFNDKLFRYLECTACNVVYVSPLPDKHDYIKMYPPGYQSGVDKTLHSDPYQKLPGLRFSYGFQFDLIKKYSAENSQILDYGCGNANFIVNAVHHHLSSSGAEFSAEHVEIMKREFPQAGFYTITEILENKLRKYDVIRLSNVLEHLDDPNSIITQLKEKLNDNGVLLVEGPVELNSNFAFFTRKIYFKWMNFLRKGYVTNHPPTHITFTNSKNQLEFFTRAGFETLEYKISESGWPYPESFKEVSSLGSTLKFIIAKLSRLFSSFSARSGNTFIYAGRK